MGTTEVTKAQWQAVMQTAPWEDNGEISIDPASPAVWIDWDDAYDFIDSLNGLTGKTFRLPTEAEWEYACRGGMDTRYYWGDDLDSSAISDNAWWTGNAWDAGERFAHVTALKLVNPLGLYDMSGNVWEWCEDWYSAYTAQAVTDPAGPATGSYRILRGGALDSDAKDCRSANRADTQETTVSYSIGFRIVRN
jgi:formylglycine-generating enzyme required for sulfatase activity